LAVLLLCLVGSGSGLAWDDREALEAAAEGLSQGARYPWYDADGDEVKQVPLGPREPPPKIRDWEWTPAQRRPAGGSGGWGQIMDVLVWAGLGILLIVLIVLIVRTYSQRTGLAWRADRFGARPAGGASDVDRVEKLPFPVQRPQADLLGEARRHYAAANYVEAIIYLFSYQLVYLDKHDLLRLAKGKTNRQYLREMRPHREIVRIVSDTMTAFEDVFFGSHPMDRHRFEACWTQLDQFHDYVQHAAAGH
jgi:hypothetical protein